VATQVDKRGNTSHKFVLASTFFGITYSIVVSVCKMAFHCIQTNMKCGGFKEDRLKMEQDQIDIVYVNVNYL
jgi:hypothetical protein